MRQGHLSCGWTDNRLYPRRQYPRHCISRRSLRFILPGGCQRCCRFGDWSPNSLLRCNIYRFPARFRSTPFAQVASAPCACALTPAFPRHWLPKFCEMGEPTRADHLQKEKEANEVRGWTWNAKKGSPHRRKDRLIPRSLPTAQSKILVVALQGVRTSLSLLASGPR
jgi:hypothetical protein